MINYKNFPKTPGVYLMKDYRGKILYIGKAGNLRRRVSSYFERPHDARIARLVREIRHINFRKTDTAIEALILEAQLIKKNQPPFNVLEKDDTSFLEVEITRTDFPEVRLVRAKDPMRGERYGPFTSASSLREALRIIRKIFPWNSHSPEELREMKRPCFNYEIGLCPGVCAGILSRREYARTVRNIRLLLKGRKKAIVVTLKHEMAQASQSLRFEEAERIKRQIFALRHIQDVALIGEDKIADTAKREVRVEGYDISNISGTSAVGSMVVFSGNKPDRNQYRKFKIYTVRHPDDVGMMRELLRRRLRHREWPFPVLMLIDGGTGQVNAARSVLAEASLKIPVLGIAKGPERKRNDFVGKIPRGLDRATLIKVRDEAHRFAINYHKRLREARVFAG